MEDTIKREDAKRYFTEFLSLNRFADFKKANIERLVGKLCERIPSAEPQTEFESAKTYTTFCGVPIAEAVEVIQRYKAEKDEPQKDCFLCKWLGEVDVCGRCRNRNLFCEAEPQPRCPKCGKRGYIRSLESMGVKLKKSDKYKWKCTNCNRYFKEEPRAVRDLQEYFGIKREPTLSEMLKNEPQAERNE